MSGTVSIFEAFRVLVKRGYIPHHGPVEFHWYAGEEGGMLGSQDIAAYKRDIGAKVGAMIEFVSILSWQSGQSYKDDARI